MEHSSPIKYVCTVVLPYRVVRVRYSYKFCLNRRCLKVLVYEQYIYDAGIFTRKCDPG